MKKVISMMAVAGLFTVSMAQAQVNEVVEIAVERDMNTGIEAVEAGKPMPQSVYYDLQGRRHTNPTKGLYIHNGKKIAIK